MEKSEDFHYSYENLCMSSLYRALSLHLMQHCRSHRPSCSHPCCPSSGHSIGVRAAFLYCPDKIKNTEMKTHFSLGPCTPPLLLSVSVSKD